MDGWKVKERKKREKEWEWYSKTYNKNEQLENFMDIVKYSLQLISDL